MPPHTGYNAPPFSGYVGPLLPRQFVTLYYYYSATLPKTQGICKGNAGKRKEMQGETQRIRTTNAVNIYHASSALSYNFLSGYNAIYRHPGVNSSRITLFQLQRDIIMTLPCGSIEQLKMEPLRIGQWPGRTQELRAKKVVCHFLA